MKLGITSISIWLSRERGGKKRLPVARFAEPTCLQYSFSIFKPKLSLFTTMSLYRSKFLYTVTGQEEFPHNWLHCISWKNLEGGRISRVSLEHLQTALLITAWVIGGAKSHPAQSISAPSCLVSPQINPCSNKSNGCYARCPSEHYTYTLCPQRHAP